MSFGVQPSVETSLNTEDQTISATYNPKPWDFDHTGGVPAWKFLHHIALQWVDTQRHWFSPPENAPPFTDMLFFRCLAFTFSPSFYHHMSPGCALTYAGKISNIGKTSLVVKQQIFDTTGKDILAEGCVQFVSVSTKTRRPQHWAPWLAQRYPELCSAPRTATVEPFGPVVAEQPFVYSVKVAPSDTDLFAHVGHFQYLRYCYDCVAFGTKTGAYSITKEDLFQHKIKSVEMLFQGEARAGDVLSVVSWEEPEKSDTIKFQVKRGDENVTQCTLQFFIAGNKM